MCVIIVAKQTPSQYTLELAAAQNPHGVGVAAMMPDGRWLVRRAMELSELELGDMRNYSPQVWHFRLATSGMINLANCQPISLHAPGEPRAEELADELIFHNGVIAALSGHPEQSDTVILARLLSRMPYEVRVDLLRAFAHAWGKFVITARGTYDVVGSFTKSGSLLLSAPLHYGYYYYGRDWKLWRRGGVK